MFLPAKICPEAISSGCIDANKLVAFEVLGPFVVSDESLRRHRMLQDSLPRLTRFNPKKASNDLLALCVF